jgi:hypothetical protein
MGWRFRLVFNRRVDGVVLGIICRVIRVMSWRWRIVRHGANGRSRAWSIVKRSVVRPGRGSGGRVSMCLTFEHVVPHGHGRMALLGRDVDAASPRAFWGSAAVTRAVHRRRWRRILQVERWQVSRALPSRRVISLTLRVVAAVIFVVKGGAASIHLTCRGAVVSCWIAVAWRCSICGGSVGKSGLWRCAIRICLVLSRALWRAVVLKRL